MCKEGVGGEKDKNAQAGACLKPQNVQAQETVGGRVVGPPASADEAVGAQGGRVRNPPRESGLLGCVSDLESGIVAESVNH